MGFTVDELARAVGRSKSYISLIENDERVPSESLIRALANVLNEDEEEWVFLAKEAPKLYQIHKNHPDHTLRFLRELTNSRSPFKQIERAIKSKKQRYI